MIGWIVLAFTCARFAAMGFNRIVDREIDARNPRTRQREIPSGALRVTEAVAAVSIASVLFVFAAWRLNPLCAVLSPVALGWVFFYSYTKRFTRWCHLVLGVGMSIAPVGGYLAVTGQWSHPWWMLIALALAVATWGGGFDILYALQDVEFDRSQSLYSLPVAFGERRALLHRARTSPRARSHALRWSVRRRSPAPAAGSFYALGVVVAAGLLVYEHSLVRPDDFSRLDAAFFTMNGVISIVFFVCVLTERLIHRVDRRLYARDAAAAMTDRPIVVAITGASGAPYAVRLARVAGRGRATGAAHRVEPWASSAATRSSTSSRFDALARAGRRRADGIVASPCFDDADRGAAPASGSALNAGMVICPCSMGTLSAIAAGASRSLVERAADVALKERRPLILVPRETPLSAIHLENMLRVTRAGAVVMPAAPGFYHRPRDDRRSRRLRRGARARSSRRGRTARPRDGAARQDRNERRDEHVDRPDLRHARPRAAGRPHRARGRRAHSSRRRRRRRRDPRRARADRAGARGLREHRSARESATCPERSISKIGGVRIHVSHGHEVGRPTPAKLLARYDADVIVYGHTHRQLIAHREARWVVNPGRRGCASVRSAAERGADDAFATDRSRSRSSSLAP